MRKIFNLSRVLVFMLCVSQGAEAQILKKIKERTVEAVENQENVEKEVEDKGIIILTGKEGREAGNVSRLLSFKNYDFVPGDKLIYYYDMADEADAEIPGRMQIDGGSLEVQTYKGDKVLFTPGGGSLYMKPYMKEDNYLPEQSTVEFDVLSNGGVDHDGCFGDRPLFPGERRRNRGVRERHCTYQGKANRYIGRQRGCFGLRVLRSRGEPPGNRTSTLPLAGSESCLE